ncbi:GMC family oxidoreductase [Streptomyces sp. LX-29]|uniref:GMC family oxidoreductase n=1 Tax=Streptomyces sp. LX-29 TaxID=2900152 RepID=UPI00240E90F2|nr:GMC family oxidoreductase [Streptomyces sp. LX-29]WFB10073.1 GMC family oxidoreductase [Streptomyces sp. LX-29]
MIFRRHPDGHRHDVIIVGGGMAGSLVAKELGDHGWRVLLLEAGTGTLATWQGHLDAMDTFYGAVAKVPNAPYRPNAAAPSPDVLHLEGLPQGGYRATGYFVQNGPLPYGSDYLRASGGAGMHWLGLTPRMLPEDFATRTRYGYGRDWPIGYDTLRPYYEAAERAIGVAGDADEQNAADIPVGADYVFPMEKIPRSYVDRCFAVRLDGRTVEDPVAGGTDFTLKVVTTPHGRNSTPNPSYDGGRGYRPAESPGLPNYGERCVGNASCTPICPVHAKYNPLKTQARFGRTVTLVTRAVVSRVLSGTGGRILGVQYQAYDDPAAPVAETRTAEADLVVLAAHAIENARLLLASGLANSSDQVGRNLMDHPVLLAWALMRQQVGPFRGPGSTSALECFRFGAARGERAPFRAVISNWGWSWATGSPGSDVAQLLREGPAPGGKGLFGRELRAALGDRIGRQIALQFEIEQSADPSNRVTVDPGIRDRLGDPRPVLTYDLSDHIKESMVSASALARKIFGMLGATDHTSHKPGPFQPGYFRYRQHEFSFHGAGHGAGTHVMGSDPSSSVVDEWQRCWDHPNLYAVGCGSMPSIGTSNPSITMAALALRSAEAIHRDLSAMHRPVRLSAAGVAGREQPVAAEAGP